MICISCIFKNETIFLRLSIKFVMQTKMSECGIQNFSNLLYSQIFCWSEYCDKSIENSKARRSCG